MMDLGSEIAALEDDMQEFNLEKTVKHSLKTPEELDKLTVDESLNDIERAVFLLSSGQEVQCICVVKSLPHLLRHWQIECLRRVMPKVKEMLLNAGSDVQLAATESFLTVAKDELVSPSQYSQHFLRTIITNMEGRDLAISRAWLDTLITVIQHLPRDMVKREILGLAIAKGQLSQPTSSRISCCSILGAIAIKFDSYVVKKDVVPTVKQLCQDVDYEVRASMCAHVHKIAKGLGQEETRKSILDEVLELARDEESSVREAALETVLNMTQLLDDGFTLYSFVGATGLLTLLKMKRVSFNKESLVESVVPLVCKYCEQAVENEDATLLSIAHNFGRLCHNISYNISNDQRSWLLSCYRYLCKLGYPNQNENSNSPTGTEAPENSPSQSLSSPKNHVVFGGVSQGSTTTSPLSIYDGLMGYPRTPSTTQRPSPGKLEMYLECRRSCAYNLPAMVQFSGADSFKTELLESTTKMCTDPDVTVRKSIASGLHEVAQILDEQSHLIHGHLVSLLRERNSAAVIDALVRNLPKTLHAVMSRGSFGLAETKPNATTELIAALLASTSRLEQQWPSSWRALENIVRHMQHLPDIMTSDHIYYKFVPVVFKLLNTNRYLPVREAATYTICIFIRHNRRQEQKKEMCNRLVQDLCYGRNYRNRILFFSACRYLMGLFSKSFFKEHLFEHVLNLFHDPVANVRLCLCKILPSLKSLLKLPSDRALHQQLESSVRRLLSSEKDKDVSDSIRYAILELDRTEVAMESLTQHMFMDEDLQDQKKEEEERMLIEKEERSKDEDSRSLKGHGSSGSSSSVGKNSIGSRSEKSHHHHHRQKRSSRNSTTIPTSSMSLKVNGNKEKSKPSHHQASTQQTPVFMHQKEGSVSNTAYQSFAPSLSNLSHGNVSSHSPTPSKSSSNHVSPSPTATTSTSKFDHSNTHQSLSSTKSSPTNTSSVSNATKSRSTGTVFLQNKSDRRRSTSLLSHSSSPNNSHRTSPNTHSSDRPRKGSFSSVSSSGSGGAVRSSKTLQQAAVNAKTNVKRKSSNVSSDNTHKKTDKNGHIR